MTRIKASFIHFLISAFVFALFLSLVFFIWYADPFNLAQGVGEIVYIMAGVDVVLGPLLTLIVFKAGKKSLKFDLSVIALIQIAALVYGGYTIYSERPAYIVHRVQMYKVVSQSQIADEEIEKEFSVGIFDRPKWVYAEPPTGKEASDILFEVFEGGKDIEARPKFYREHDSHVEEILAEAHEVPEELAQYQEQKATHFVPLVGKKRDIIILFNDKGQRLGYLMQDPWPFVPKKQSNQQE